MPQSVTNSIWPSNAVLLTRIRKGYAIVKHRKQCMKEGHQYIRAKPMIVCNAAGTFRFEIEDLVSKGTPFQPRLLYKFLTSLIDDGAPFSSCVARLIIGSTRVTISNFQNGQTVITGTVTRPRHYMIGMIYRQIIESVLYQGQPRYVVKNVTLTMCNMVLRGHLPYSIDPIGIVRDTIYPAVYDPRVFPGAGLRAAVIGAPTITFFDTGAVIICGLWDMSKIERVWEEILALGLAHPDIDLPADSAKRSKRRLQKYLEDKGNKLK